MLIPSDEKHFILLQYQQELSILKDLLMIRYQEINGLCSAEESAFILQKFSHMLENIDKQQQALERLSKQLMI